MHMEFTIRHDGKDWIVENQLLAVSAPTLRELDCKVGKLMKENGMIKKGQKAKVLMAFDNSTIPQWIRQYAQHYFNRIIYVEG